MKQNCPLLCSFRSEMALLVNAGSPQRLVDFYIRVGQTFDQGSFDPTSYTQCAYQSIAMGPGETKVFECDQTIEGRFLTVHFPTTRTAILTLCEVAVYSINHSMHSLY